MNLKQFDAVQLQTILRNLSISDAADSSVIKAAHKLYWDQLWPNKLTVPDSLGRRLLSDTRYTGTALIESVNCLDPKLVLDIGCGENFYKNKIKNIVGIDLYGKNADISADYFNGIFDKKADVILALGLLEYGYKSDVEYKLRFIQRNCHENTQIFFRFNLSPQFDYEIVDGYDICYFMNKLIQTPDAWNNTIQESGYQILDSDWDTPDQRWYVKAKLK